MMSHAAGCDRRKHSMETTIPTDTNPRQTAALDSGALFGPRLTGLQKLCKLYGRMQCGDAMMAWDYANNVALPEKEFRKDKTRWAASERAKYGALPNAERTGGTSGAVTG